MRKIITSLFLFIAFLGVAVALQPTVSVGAAPSPDPLAAACTGAGANSAACKGKGQTDNPLVGSKGVLNNVVNILGIVAGVMVTIMIIIGGIKYAASNGDSSQTASAKNIIIYGLVGLAVVVLARVIVGLVVSNL